MSGLFERMRNKSYVIHNEMGQLLAGLEKQLKEDKKPENEQEVQKPRIVSNRVQKAVRLRSSVAEAEKETTHPITTKVMDMVSDIFN